MAQHDMNIANQGFPATRADLNNALQALVSNSSGATAPSTTFANQWWYDTTNNKMYLRNEANNAWIEVFTLDQTNNEWQLVTGQISAADGDGIAFKTDDGTTRVKLDDSGNLLVGTTTNSSANNGVTAGNSGLVTATRTSNYSGIFNRLTSDGDIVQFRKDGTTVGNIGSRGGADLYVGSGDTNFKFAAGSDAIVAATTAGADRDNAIDLGISTVRYKDLYLSGGAYLGGTGAANYLDDFEEGTFTATIEFGGGTTGQTYATQTGYYTKIGSSVTCTLYVLFSNKGSSTGAALIQGLPFTNKSGTAYFAGGLHLNTISFTGFPQAYTLVNTTSVKMGETTDAGVFTELEHTNFANSSGIIFTTTYCTN